MTNFLNSLQNKIWAENLNKYFDLTLTYKYCNYKSSVTHHSLFKTEHSSKTLLPHLLLTGIQHTCYAQPIYFSYIFNIIYFSSSTSVACGFLVIITYFLQYTASKIIFWNSTFKYLKAHIEPGGVAVTLQICMWLVSSVLPGNCKYSTLK